MSKSFALAAFNAAVVITNGAHAVKRCAESTTTASKEVGVAFWAGMKYAHQHNMHSNTAAVRLTAEDVETSKPSAKRGVRTVTKHAV